MLPLLFEDGEILVLDKPAGLASQPGAGVRLSLVEAVERDFGFRPFLVHRLDRETAGLIVVARDARAAAKWTGLVAGKAVRKTYRAIVAGEPSRASGIFREDVSVRGATMSAETRWELVGSFGAVTTAATAATAAAAPTATTAVTAAMEATREPGLGPATATRRFSLLELELGTGRTHQIRLHLAGAGLPILGDDRHGDFALNRALKKECGLKRLLLLAWRLELPGGITLSAAVPGHFSGFLERFPDAPPTDTPCGAVERWGAP